MVIKICPVCEKELDTEKEGMKANGKYHPEPCRWIAFSAFSRRDQRKLEGAKHPRIDDAELLKRIERR